MDINELVRQIVEEVLRRARPVEAKPLALALADPDQAVTDKLHSVLGAEVEFVWLRDWDASRVPDRCIAPLLSCSDMADLAMGKAGSPLAKAILGLLLSGRPVEVLEFEYTRYLDTAPSALHLLYEGYEKTLAGFGLAGYKAPAPEAIRLKKRLITGACVARAGEQGVKTLLVPAGAVITPLARDMANDLQIGLVKES